MATAAALWTDSIRKISVEKPKSWHYNLLICLCSLSVNSYSCFTYLKRFFKNVLIRNTEPENNMKYEQTDLWPAVLEVESNIYVYFYLIF